MTIPSPHRSSARFRRLLFLALLLSPAVGTATPPGWTLVWSDEFAQLDGTRPDPAKWGYDTGGGGWGNNEIQYYTDRAENARIVDGKLLIEAREESFGGRNHTSARLLTKGKWDWTYGRFEARVKVPKGAGLWPAFWMLGADIDSVGWPQCGEIDVMEYVGRLPKEVFGTIHGPGYAGGDSIGGTYSFVPDVADDFHVFAVEWEENVIRWYVDGIHYFTATPASLGGRQWVFDHPHFLIVNLALDGNFAGPLDPAVVFPQQLWVDYVRVYARDPGAGNGALQNGGFETGALGDWTGYVSGGANDAGCYVESTSFSYYNGGNPGGDNVRTRSGQYVGKVFGDFSGGENFNGCFQDVSVAPGTEWTAEGWALTHPQDLMVGANTAWLEVSFRDAADVVLALYRSPVLTSTSVVPDSWTLLEVTEQLDPVSFAPLGTVGSMIAPPGSSKARFQVVFRQPGFDGGAMYFDDLRLAQVVGPAVATPPGINFREGSLLTWSASQPEATYQLQESADNVTWADLGPPIFGTLTTSLFDPDGAMAYRVVRSGLAGPAILPVVATPGIELEWDTVVGIDYQVQQSTNLLNWSDLGPETDGTGSAARRTDGSGATLMYYRVRETSP